MTAPLLSFSDVWKTYGRGEATVNAFNQRMVSKSTRYVFYHKQDDAITALVSAYPMDCPACETV